VVQINDPQVLAEVSAAFQRYQDAIIDNDVAVLNELFWDDALTLRYGTGENLYGHEAIASFRTTRTAAQHAREETKRVVTCYGRTSPPPTSSSRGGAGSGARARRGCACPKAGASSRRT
jgi:hypothetical protein